tara:strand:- start:1 stop:180 length:180 start_codon:yes stop_codon:yes gene_type:complete
MKIGEWVRKLQILPGSNRRRVHNGIRNQMKADEDTFDAKWWDTEITESKWKEMLKEALK